MPIPVSIEKMETRWIAYGDSFFGLFASDEDRDEAVAKVPGALRVYMEWCSAHCMPVVQAPDPREPVEINEIVQEWVYPANGEAINAFFASDVPPLSAEEVDFIDCLLEWTRSDLLDAFVDLPQEALTQQVEGDWSIAGIVYHTVRADWAYLKALGLAPGWSEAPKEKGLVALINWTQSLWQTALPGLVDSARVEVVEGELWSPRKMVRRGIWHRKDHTGHVWEFRGKIGA